MIETAGVGLSESKLRVPMARAGMVPRTHLVDQLVDADDARVVSVVAPAGYGKTTLLTQWAAGSDQAVGWVSADARDNDPGVLLAHVAAAVDRIEPIDPGVFRAVTSPSASTACPPLLADAMAVLDTPVCVVIDHLETVTRRESLDAVTELVMRLPPGCRLVVASRDRPPVPTARLRAEGRLIEIGQDDLAMSEEEAYALLRGTGADLDDEEVRELVRHTEGWAVGLYLAALALNAGGAVRAPSGATFAGDHRFMSDYLRAEFLARMSPDEVAFLTRTSVLDQMCGPLCDATLDLAGSADVLDDLESRNLLVVPLDPRREWYRYHHLFRELLSRELERREPDLVPELHRRAAAWCEANGQPEVAIEHAQAAGDAVCAERLVLQLANPVWASGRADTVLRWMEWFEAQGLVDKHPGIAAHGALMFALAGRPGDTERWAEAAMRAPSGGVLEDGNTVDGTLAYLRALLCRDGVEAMRSDAELAWRGLNPGSPYRATMLHAEGMSHLLDGDPERADTLFAQAVDAAVSSGSVPFVPVVLAGRGIIAIDRGDWTAAEGFASQALAVMREGDFDDYWTSALVYAWAGRVALHRGDVDAGQDHLTRAARLRGLLSYALPVVSVQALLEMARGYVALADRAGARTVLRQVRDIFQQRHDLGVLASEVDRLSEQVDTIDPAVPGASSLTTAELRLLPLLSTHLSFREIGERLYVSRHTVKTQAISIYRKLGVSSRSDAISRMHDLGLLAHGG